MDRIAPAPIAGISVQRFACKVLAFRQTFIAEL
jgi:hypothetical protein